MSEIYLSATRLKSFENCPLKYKKMYVDKMRDDQSVFSQYGSLVHAALKFYHDKTNWENREAAQTSILEFYRAEFKKPEYELVTSNFFLKGELLLIDYLKTSFAKQPALRVEEKFEGYLSGNGVPVIAIIDRVDQISEKKIRVIDYKTGQSFFPTQYEIDQDIQLSLYDLVVREWYPNVEEVELVLHFFNGDTMMTSRNEYQRQAFSDYLGLMYEKMSKEVNFAPRINEYCHACKFRGECPAYQKVLSEPVDIMTDGLATVNDNPKRVAVKTIEFKFPDDLEKLAKFLSVAKRKIKILEKICDEGDGAIAKYMQENQQDVLDLEGYTVTVNQKKYENIDAKAAYQILNPLGEFFNVAKIVKKDVETVLKNLERVGHADKANELRNKLQSAISVNFSNPSLQIEAKKMIGTLAPVTELTQVVGAPVDHTPPPVEVAPDAPKKARGRPKKALTNKA